MRIRLVAALALLTGGLAGATIVREHQSRCDERFDSAAWRRADFDSSQRSRLADHIVDCGTLDGATRRRVELTLGREHPSTEQLPDEPGVAHAAYPVGTVNDALGPGDGQDLVIHYDRRWRVVAAELSPPG